MINKKLVRPRIMSDAFSRNMEENYTNNPCIKCGKLEVVKGTKEYPAYCNACGHIQNQKLAKKFMNKENKEIEENIQEDLKWSKEYYK